MNTLSKVVLSTMAPAIIAWTFAEELARGIRRAFYRAWLAAAFEFATYKDIMRGDFIDD